MSYVNPTKLPDDWRPRGTVARSLFRDPSRAELEQRKVMVYRGEVEPFESGFDELGLDGASEYLAVLSTIRTTRDIFQD